VAAVGLAVAAAFQLSSGDVNYLELTRASAVKRGEVVEIAEKSCGHLSISAAAHRKGAVISDDRAARIADALQGEFARDDVTRGRVTMIAMTTAAFFLIRASLVIGLVVLPVHLIRVVPGFGPSMFGIVVSLQSVMGLLSVRSLAPELDDRLGNLAANAVLAILMAVSSLSVAAMQPWAGAFNWVLLLCYCCFFGPAISGHYALGPPALAHWATPEMRGVVISLGGMANAATHIIMPVVFSSILEATSAAFVYSLNALLASLAGLLFFLMHAATADPGLPSTALARRLCGRLAGGQLAEDDPIFGNHHGEGTGTSWDDRHSNAARKTRRKYEFRSSIAAIAAEGSVGLGAALPDGGGLMGSFHKKAKASGDQRGVTFMT